MNIKSDTNNHKIRKFFSKFILEYNYNPLSVRLGLLLIFSGIGYQLWDFSGLLSALSYATGTIFFIFTEDNLLEKIFKLFFVTLGLCWIGSVNAYYVEERKLDIVYSKKEFIDSTQKLVVYAESPIKEPLVLEFKTDKKYFSLKNSKKLSFYIEENKVNDHLDKLFQPDHIEEWKYTLFYNSDTISGSIKEWRVSKTRLFKNIKVKK